jgi:ankyrin repeat protein
MAIIEKNTNLIHQPDLAGDTFFHANPLQPDSYGNTVLHYLADELSPDPERKSHFDIFRKFLAAGVDINAKNRKGETPLFRYVLQNSYHWVFPSDEEEPSHPCFDFFQETGADFFARNNAGSTLLHLVASVRSRSKFNEKEAVEYEVQSFKILIGMGLDPMTEDMQQRTSLDVAAACGSEHILKL